MKHPSFLTVALLMMLMPSCHSASRPLPNRVFSPAPSVDAIGGRCPFGPPRASTIPNTSIASVVDDHFPHWLPSGMGLVEAFGPGNPAAHGGAYFADARCREIELWFWTSGPVGPGQKMGPWTVADSGPGGAPGNPCGNEVLGPARCIHYDAEVGDGMIGLQMMGIGRAVGDRIARSIPL